MRALQITHTVIILVNIHLNFESIITVPLLFYRGFIGHTRTFVFYKRNNSTQ